LGENVIGTITIGTKGSWDKEGIVTQSQEHKTIAAKGGA